MKNRVFVREERTKNFSQYHFFHFIIYNKYFSGIKWWYDFFHLRMSRSSLDGVEYGFLETELSSSGDR